MKIHSCLFLYGRVVPLNQTAFGCFKTDARNVYVWFYSSRQSLGKEAPRHICEPIPEDANEGQRALPAEDPLTLKIIKDLKSKGEV